MPKNVRDDVDDDRKIQLIELPSPFPLEPGTLRLLEPASGFNGGYLERLVEGTLGRPFVFDTGAERHLLFSTAAVQSSMRLDDPDALVTAYARKMMAFLLFMPEPRHVLMIGLGGGSLAKFCYRHLPQTRISVIEINADVISLREHFAIPPDDESRYPVPVQSLRKAFDGAVVLVPVQVDGNVLLFAFKKPQLARVPEALQDRAAELEKELGLEFRKYLQRLRTGPTLRGRQRSIHVT